MTSLPDDAVVTYAFHDSSVPPQYHRSVTLTLTCEQAHIVIDSYGTVLAEQTRSTSLETWRWLSGTISTVATLTVQKPAQGCTGGTSMDIHVDTPGGRLLDLRPEFCGGVNTQAREAIRAWIAPALGLFPPVSELAPEGG